MKTLKKCFFFKLYIYISFKMLYCLWNCTTIGQNSGIALIFKTIIFCFETYQAVAPESWGLIHQVDYQQSSLNVHLCTCWHMWHVSYTCVLWCAHADTWHVTVAMFVYVIVSSWAQQAQPPRAWEWDTEALHPTASHSDTSHPRPASGGSHYCCSKSLGTNVVKIY